LLQVQLSATTDAIDDCIRRDTGGGAGIVEPLRSAPRFVGEGDRRQYR
jgi:hypothetical protein